MIRIFHWIITRRLMHEPLRAILIAGTTALGVSVFLAILYAAEESIESFSASSRLLSSPSIIQSRFGPITRAEIRAWMPTLSHSVSVLPYAERSATRQDTQEPIALLALDMFQYTDSHIPNFEVSNAAFVHESLLNSLTDTQGSGRTPQLCLSLSAVPRCFSVYSVTTALPRSVPSSQSVIIDLSTLDAWEGKDASLTALAFPNSSQLDLTQRDEELRQFLTELTGGRWQLISAVDQQKRAERLLSAFRLNVFIMLLMTLLVCVCTIFNGAHVGMRHLLPILATLHTLGLPRAVGVFFVLGEALLYGVCGAALGLLLGFPLSVATARVFLGTAETLYGVSVTHLSLNPFTHSTLYLLSFGCGVLVCLLGAALPARSARGLVPSIAVTRPRIESAPRSLTRLLLASLCAVTAVWATHYAWHAPQVVWAHAAAFFLIIAVLFVSAPALLVSIASVRLVLRPWSGAALLMAINGLSSSLRSYAVTVATSASAVSLLIGLGVMITSFRDTLSEWVAHSVIADVYIEPVATNQSIEDSTISALRSLSNVAAVVRASSREATVCADHCLSLNLNFNDVSANTASRQYSLLNGSWDHASFQSGQGGFLTESASKRLRATTGSTLSIEFADAQHASIRVLGVYKDFVSEHGALLLSFDAWRDRFALEGAARISLHLTPSARYEDVASTLRTDSRFSLLRVRDQRSLRESVFQAFDETFRITELLRAIVMLLCALGFAVTLMQRHWEQRKEWRAFQILGAPDSALLKSMVLEVVLLFLPSIILGTVAGLLLAKLLVHVINPLSFGWTLEYSLHTMDLVLPVGALSLAYLVPLLWYLRRIRVQLAQERISDE